MQKQLQTDWPGAVGALLVGFWVLSCAGAMAGDPIVFIRPPKASATVQLPVRQQDTQILRILDALEAPNPADSIITGPTPDRPRPGRDGRRNAIRSSETEDWLWDEDNAMDDDQALNDRYGIDSKSGLGSSKENRGIGLSKTSSEPGSPEGEARIPSHLMAPSTRQRLVAEMMALRRTQREFSAESGSEFSDDVEFAQRVDLSRLLAPPENRALRSPGALQELLRTPAIPELAPSSTPYAPINTLGDLGGLELGPRLEGPNLGGPRLGASILDRPMRSGSTGPEMEPPASFGFGSGPASFGAFPSQGERVGSAFPGVGRSILTQPEAPSRVEVPDYAPPRRW